MSCTNPNHQAFITAGILCTCAPQRWMVVDRHRTPVGNCINMYRRENAQQEADILNNMPLVSEYGPYRVAEDTVAMDPNI